MKKLFYCFFILFCFNNCTVIKRVLNQDNDNVNYLSNSEIEAYNYSFTEATKQKIFSNYNQAINLFFKCIEINPKSSAAYYQLSDIYLINGDKDRALGFARKSTILNSKNIWYKLQLAKIYQTIGKKDSTIIVYKQIVKSNPKKFEYQFNLALLYIEVGEHRKAINILKELEDSNGLSEEIALTLYQVYNNLKENKNCVKILKEAIKKYPEDSKFIGLLAEHYAVNNDYELALKYYLELLAIYPENEKGILSLIEFYRLNAKFSEAFGLADNFIKNENFKFSQKIEILSEFINDTRFFNQYKVKVRELIDFLEKINEDEIKVLTLSADFYIKNNDLLKAKNELLMLSQRADSNYIVWEQLFYVLSSLSDYELIYSLSENVLIKFNDKPILYLFRGIAEFQLKKYKESIEVLNKGIIYARNSSELELQFFTFLGEAYNALNDFKNSDIYFSKALNIDSTNLYLLNNYSYYLALRNENLEFAFKNIEKCIDIEPNNINYLESYGYILFKLNRFVEAKNVFEKAFELGGIKNANAIEHYLEILVRLDLKELVVKYYKVFLENGNKSEYINKLVNTYLN